MVSKRTCFRCLVVLAALLLLPTAGMVVAAEEQDLLFERDVAPLLRAKCLRCHGEETHKAELNLGDPQGVRRGGESGAAIEPGKPDESLLYEMVHEGLMPPDEKDQLSAAQVDTIRRWITSGARFADVDPAASGTAAVTQHDVTPILLRRCTVCHGPQYQQGGLDLRDKAAMLRGGTSGPALVPGEPENSALVARVETRQCPPKADLGEAGIEPMKPHELETVVAWIRLGAPEAKEAVADAGDNLGESASEAAADPLVSDDDRQFWSFQPPRRPEVPTVQHAERVRNPIDAFLLARLQEHGLSFSPEADKLTLLRRASFALTGLPPEPAEIERYLADDAPLAYERMIDRLLESPRYGERWARFWLDLAGYADSEGKRNADTVRPWAWRYRDYVIRSLNDDKPYNEFLLEQLAGDELVDYANADAVTDETVEKLVATGFLRMAPDGTAADPVNRVSDRIEVIADEIDVLSRGVMGLTMKCARCHSHKYDPLPQRDYYRLVAIFKGAFDEYDWLVPQPFGNQWKKAHSRYLAVATPAERREVEAHNAPLRKQIAALEAEKKQKGVAKQRAKEIDGQLKKLESKLREVPKIRALWDRGTPSPTYIYRRGDETQPTREVRADVPSVLKTSTAPLDFDGLAAGAPLREGATAASTARSKTGRRLALARWLTRPDHPLTARVFVNRIWHHHFGVGIVKSLDNFGKLGTPPSHPELLDWLAVEFVEQGWSVKTLHRQIMTSSAYRQSSTVLPQHERLDPENRWLSRMPMRRMEAEEVRDSILQVAGRLELQPFGAPDPVEVRKDGLVTSRAIDGKWRRSVYVRQRRKEMPSILETFDLPQMNPNCIARKDSTVVSQPLHLLNNKMIYELADAMAERVRREANPNPDDRLRHAWLLALSRPPSDEELRLARQSLVQLTEHWKEALSDEATSNDAARKSADKQNVEKTAPDTTEAAQRALADVCHGLINSAAFLYID